MSGTPLSDLKAAHQAFTDGLHQGGYEGEPVSKYNPSKAHPGFAAVVEKIAKRGGYSKERASAILASAGRNASAKAKRANPNLKKIKGA